MSIKRNPPQTTLNLLEEELHRLEWGEPEENFVTLPDKEIMRIIEALLFSSKDPVPLDKIRELLLTMYPIRRPTIKKLIAQMQAAYIEERRAFQIEEIGGGYLLRTVSEMAPYLERLHHNRRGEKLTPAATEVLAIVAYKGPITRTEIDSLRGVDSSGTLSSLIERELVEGIGRKEGPGRPMQYATTTRFLSYFGLRNQQELPNL